MRYLFGDSAPFPYAFNFLAVVESFLRAATKSVQLESESRAIEINTAASSAARLRGLDELKAFHDAVVRAIQDSGAKRTSSITGEYVSKLIQHANDLVSDTERSVAAVSDRDQATVRLEVDRRRADIQAEIEGFLLVSRLPTTATYLTLDLEGSVYRAKGLVSYPDGIRAEYQLAPQRIQGWSAPRRIGELVSGLTLRVGIKRGLFRKGVQLERISIDDYILSGASFAENRLSIRFRRSLKEAKECLVLEIGRNEGGVLATVKFPSEEEIEPQPADLEDLEPVGRLWDAMSRAFETLSTERDALLALRIEDEDVFEHDLGIVLIERLVRLLAPTFVEIVKRSPNPDEFSLKSESDSGRREEVYVLRKTLVDLISILGDKERSIFAPFGLITLAPPSGPDGLNLADDSD